MSSGLHDKRHITSYRRDPSGRRATSFYHTELLPMGQQELRPVKSLCASGPRAVWGYFSGVAPRASIRSDAFSFLAGPAHADRRLPPESRIRSYTRHWLSPPGFHRPPCILER